MSRVERLHKHRASVRLSLVKAMLAVTAGALAGLLSLSFLGVFDPAVEVDSPIPAMRPGESAQPVAEATPVAEAPLVAAPATGPGNATAEAPATGRDGATAEAPPVAAPASGRDGATAEAPATEAAPERTPADPRWAPLQEQLEQHFAAYPGRWASVVVDLTTGDRWEYNAEDRFHPASTIKMPVTLYALHEHMAGRFDWNRTITYMPEDFESPGGGAFETSPFGGQYPVSNLIYRSLVYSNNVAVNMLGRTLGWNNIRTFTRSIDGELYRADDGTPQITAHSAAGWWLHLLEVQREAPEKAELLLEPLRDVAYGGRISAGLPPDTPHLHKFGSYDGNFHDTGVVFGDNPYVVVFLTGNMKEGEADQAIAGASRIVWDFFGGE